MVSNAYSKSRFLGIVLGLTLMAGCASSDLTRESPGSIARSGIPGAQRPASHGALAARLARQMVGTPYRFGGATPESGFDCSGLVFYSYAQAGAAVPRTSLDQFRAARKIALTDAEPGDVVFFQDQEKLSHVGIYLGNRQFVHAPSSGKQVAVAHIDTRYYQEHLVAVGRLSPN